MAPRSLPPANKRKNTVVENISAGLIEEVALLEKQITDALQNGGSLNALADLVLLAQTSSANVTSTSKSIYALYRIYVTLLSSGKLMPGGDDAAKVVRTWIWERLNIYTDILCGLLQDTDKSLRISAVQILFSLLKHLSSFLCAQSPTSPQLHVAHFRKIVHALLICPPSHRTSSSFNSAKIPEGGSAAKKRKLLLESDASAAELDPDIREHFSETWLIVHDDIRWFFLREAATIISSQPRFPQSQAAANLLSLLEKLKTLPSEAKELDEWWVPELGKRPASAKGKGKATADEVDDGEDAEAAKDVDAGDEDDWRKFFDDDDSTKVGAKAKGPANLRKPVTLHASLHSLPAHRAVFTKCWLSLLPCITSTALTSRALAIFHRLVLPHLTRPVLVVDWVGEAVDKGGATGLLALNTLFILMTSHNLDYPSFYTKLYSFLDRNVLHMVHRARFFRIVEKCLSSTLLPATIIASFIKRLSRLSLTAPPAAHVAIVPFTYNVLKNNPSLMVMIHRIPDNLSAFEDPFNPAEPDPQRTNALDSSLWELRGASGKHFHAAVFTMFKVLEAPFTKPSYQLEDFIDHSYSTMFETEARRRVKQDPAVVDEKVVGELFPTTKRETEATVDVVTELWSFGVEPVI